MGERKASSFRRTCRGVLLSLALLLLAAAPALAGKIVGTFTAVEGNVDVMRGGALPAVAARIGVQVEEGDFVRTKTGARAEITFGDGNVLRVAQRSRVDISQYLGTDEGDSRTLRLPRGKVQAVVTKAKAEQGKGKRFEIHTPNAVAGVRGTDFFVFHDRNVTGVVVREGAVYAYNPLLPREMVTVPAGMTTTIAEKRAPQSPRPTSGGELQRHDGDVAPSRPSSQEKGKEPAAAGQQGETPAAQAGNGTVPADSTPAGEQQAPPSSAAAGEPAQLPTLATMLPDTQQREPLAKAAAPLIPLEVINPPQPPFVPPTPPPVSETTPAAESASANAVSETTQQTSNTPTTTTTQTTTTMPPPTTTTQNSLFSLGINASLLSRGNSIDPQSSLLVINASGTVIGQVDVMQSPWSGASVPLQLRGSAAGFTGGATTPHYWEQVISSAPGTAPSSTSTSVAGVSTTTDGAGIYGFLAGIDRPSPGLIEGGWTALYVDPGGKAGILRGSFGTGGSVQPVGLIDPVTGTWRAEGTLQAVEINSVTGLVPSSLGDPWWKDQLVTISAPVVSQNASTGFGPTSDGGFLDSSFNVLGNMKDRGDRVEFSFLRADRTFGIWRMESFGRYNITSPSFTLLSEPEWSTAAIAGAPEHSSTIVSVGNWGGDGRLTATSYGAWGDWGGGTTRIMTGSLLGTANTAASTFGAATNGSWLDTGTFLGNLSLAGRLGFPTTPVADLSLSGSTATMSVNASNIRFFAYQSADPVTLWATDTVNGTFSGQLLSQSSVPLANATGTVQGKFHLFNVGVSPVNGRSVWIGELEAFGPIPLAGGGFYQNSFDGIAAGTFTNGSFTGTAAGTGHPLQHLARVGGGFGQAEFRSFSKGPPASYVTESQLTGLVGGLSLWGTTPSSLSDVKLAGVLGASLSSPGQLFLSDFSSFDRISNTATTRDGGAYWAMLSGANASGPPLAGFQPLTTRFTGLFVDPAGHAGILLGGLDGFADPQSLIVEMHGGLLPPIELSPTSPVAALDLAANITSVAAPLSLLPGNFGGANSIFPDSGGLDNFEMRSIAGINDWGLFRFTSSGAYNAPNADLWTLPISIPGGSLMLDGGILGNSWNTATNKIHGFTNIAFADVTATPRAGIVVGETIGTFDPNAFTWQLVTSGAWLDAARIAQLATTAAGQTTLQQLSLPAFEIGSADLSGSSIPSADSLSVTMTGVKFLAPSAGGRPTIWATGSVSGTYTGNPLFASPVQLNQSGGTNASGVSAEFSMSSFSGGKWQGVVSSPLPSGTVGTHSGIGMKGLAAGTFTGAGSGTISGMAAGQVQ